MILWCCWAQGTVVLCLFALLCKPLSFEARGKSDENANVRLKYSIFGDVVPRRANFAKLPAKSMA